MGKIDDMRRPEVQAESAKPTDRIGAPGTAIWGGYIQSNEKDSRLQGSERYKTYSDIVANVAIIGAGVRHFLNLIGKAKWKVEPADDSAEAKKKAETVQNMMDDMETPWGRVVKRMAMYRFYGFGIQEWTAKQRDDGVMGMLDVEARPQKTIDRWDTDKHGKVLAAIQRDPQTFRDIGLPREKLIYLTDDALSTSPEGLGLFRHIVESARRLRRYEQLEGFGYENNLKGIPILRAPLMEMQKLIKAGTLTEADRDALLAPLQQFLENHIKNPELGLLLDSQPWQTSDERSAPSTVYQQHVQLLDGGTYSLAEIADAIIRVETDIARVLGVEHLLLGASSSGSFALSKDKTQSFGLIVDSTLSELRDVFQKDFFGPIWKLNGWDDKLMPKLVVEQVTNTSLSQISSVIRDMASAGVVLDREDELVTEVLKLMGLPQLIGAIIEDPDAQLAARSPSPKPDPNGTERPVSHRKK